MTQAAKVIFQCLCVRLAFDLDSIELDGMISETSETLSCLEL